METGLVQELWGPCVSAGLRAVRGATTQRLSCWCPCFIKAEATTSKARYSGRKPSPVEAGEGGRELEATLGYLVRACHKANKQRSWAW